MALNWKIFTQRPYIASLSLEEQVRLFRIANEKSIKLREQRFVDFANSNSTSQGAAGTGPAEPTFTNNFSLDFDGTSDILSFRSPTETALVTVFGQMTISFWMKASTQSTGGFGALLFKGGSADGNSYSWFGTGIYINGDNLRWVNLNASQYNLANASLGNQITDDQWHHVVIQTNPDETNRIDCIVDNGTRIENTTDYRFSYGDGIRYPHMSTITSFANSSVGYNGLFDEFAFWPKQLTDAELTTLYNGGVPGDITSLSGGPTAWFRFEEGSGTSPIDTMGNETGATISGVTYQLDTPT